MGTESVPPPEMLFDPSCYRHMCRMGTSCRVKETLDVIETKLKDDKIAWFHHHPQFKHVFHISRYSCHKLMGLWALATSRIISGGLLLMASQLDIPLGNMPS